MKKCNQCNGAPKSIEYSNMDAFIKFILAVALAGMSFLLYKPASLGILVGCLLIVTLAVRIKLRTLVLSTASYCIVVLIPYFFGLLLNSLFLSFVNYDSVANHQVQYEIFLRLFRLFIIWYVSILYFQTTPMKTLIGLLDKFLTPLKLTGVPVADYLKVVMCIVIELKETGFEIKKSLEESMRSVAGGTRCKLKTIIKGIAQIIVSMIVSSFEKLEKIQSFVEKVNPADLYESKFKVSKSDAVLLLSFILLVLLVFNVEKGHWL